MPWKMLGIYHLSMEYTIYKFVGNTMENMVMKGGEWMNGWLKYVKVKPIISQPFGKGYYGYYHLEKWWNWGLLLCFTNIDDRGYWGCHLINDFVVVGSETQIGDPRSPISDCYSITLGRHKPFFWLQKVVPEDPGTHEWVVSRLFFIHNTGSKRHVNYIVVINPK